MVVNKTNTDPWLTPDEMAKVIPLHPSTIIRHIQSGNLQGIHPGKRYFVKRSVFLAWVEAQMISKTQEGRESNGLLQS